MKFSERVEAEKEFREWANENAVADCPQSVFAWLETDGMYYLRKLKGLRSAYGVGCEICGGDIGETHVLFTTCEGCAPRVEVAIEELRQKESDRKLKEEFKAWLRASGCNLGVSEVLIDGMKSVSK